jgi:protein-S-isoprenylcysteine O-methyltransferase Ste14
MDHDTSPKKHDRRFWLAFVAKLISTVAFIWAIAALGIRADYWQGYVICAYLVILAVVMVVLFRKKSEVLRERLDPGPGIKGWDRLFWFFYNFFSLVLFFVVILDGGIYHWSGEIPMAVYVLAFAGLALSTAAIVWAMYVNRFFSTRVRIQKERGHTVITTGPYSFVRHPGYLAVFFMFPSISVAMGSLWGLIVVALVLVTVVIRTHLEDKTLKRELPGYEEYAKKVRYRLFPGVW